jgi:pyruvate,water dikinase
MPNNTTKTTNQTEQQADIKSIGKKGLFLRDMVKAKVLVPPGFIITALFDRFMKETRLYAKIEAVMTVIKPIVSSMDSISRASSEIISLINKTKFPKKLEKNIIDEFAKLKSDYVAVRHSVVIKDSLNVFLAKEFAPQLNIDKNSLIPTIKNAWASFYSPAAIVYRLESGMGMAQPFSALLIQKMIAANVSGVCFTIHPTMQVPTQIFIEANLGINRGQSSQAFDRDTYVVNKKNGKILGKTLLPQKTMLTRVDSHTKEIEVGAVDSGRQKLTDNQIITLAKLAQRIEDFYGGVPQRIEWALEKGNFYVFEATTVK